MNTLKTACAAVIIILLLIGIFFLGYRAYPYRNPVATATETDTIYLPDTTTHTIPDKPPEYIIIKDSVKYRDRQWMDSVVKANKVDTAAIMRKFYAIHYYTRSWQDSLISITRHDAIAENNFIDSKLQYELLKPQTVINKTIIYTYDKYLYAGLNVPINNINASSLEVLYATQKAYYGIGYSPGSKTFSLKAGVKLIQFSNAKK